MAEKQIHKKELDVPNWFKENLPYDYLLPNQAAFCVQWFKIKKLMNEKFSYRNEDGVEKVVKTRKFGPNYFVVSGTGTGKSLIAQIAMVSTISEKGGPVIYSGNYKALINEQYEEIQKLCQGQKMKIIRKTGDFSSTGVEELGRYDIILTTYESCEQILQNRPRWLDRVHLIVIDEIHTIGDNGRGPILESVIAMSLSLEIPLIFLSATVGDVEDIEGFAKNLNATLIDAHDFRLVPLEKFILYGSDAYFNNGRVRVEIKKKTGRFDNTSSAVGAMKNFALWVIFEQARKSQEEGARIPQILCFIKSRNDAINNCKSLVKRIKELLNMAYIQKNYDFRPFNLDEIKEIKMPTSNILLSDVLKETIPYRVAFHSSSLTLDWRTYVERLFKLGYLRVIWSTPTLSAGVNLPAQYTLIYPQIGIQPLQINKYKQSIGRAGRPKYDKKGYGGIVAIRKKDLKEKEEIIDYYLNKYLNAPTETIYSSMLMVEEKELEELKIKKRKLDNELMLEYLNRRKLRTHPNYFAFILKLISGGYATNKQAIIEFCKKYLLLFRQFPKLPVNELVEEGIEVLLDPYKVVRDGGFGQVTYRKAFGDSFPLIDENEDKYTYFIRPLGELSIKNYLMPLSASIFASLNTNKEILHRLFINKNEDIIAKKLLYYVGLVPDFYSQISLPSSILMPLLNEYENQICDESFILEYDFIKIDPSACYTRFGYPSFFNLVRTAGQLRVKSFISWWVSLISEDWINEVPMRRIEEKYNISFGNYMNYLGQNGIYVWLLQSAAFIAMHYNNKSLYKNLFLLSKRVEKGCRSEILHLTYLRNVGRDRARQLWNLGYKTIESIAEATPSAIAQVKGLSLNLAEGVIKQAKFIAENQRKKKKEMKN
ncbi:MAG: DEAD/DEAH box helicase [Candidatus Helarchaeota archaeon]